MKINVFKEVEQCYHGCDFFGKSMDGMYCMHPKLKNSGIQGQHIINQDNSRGRVPDKCPLREEILETNIIYKLK